MRFLAIDIETTGLDPKQDQIIEIGAVAATETEILGKFRFLIKFERFSGQAVALAMNAELLKEAAEIGEPADRLPENLYRWLISVGFPLSNKFGSFPDGFVTKKLEPITLAGKNVGSFDLQFILEQWSNIYDVIPFRHRILDVGSMYVRAEDHVIPDLKECKKRAGLLPEVAHNAVGDAMDVVQCVQRHFGAA